MHNKKRWEQCLLMNRKIKILEAIINDYINTGEPVGSRTLAKKYNLGVGSATIRNEMADLEDMGFLESTTYFSRQSSIIKRIQIICW